MNDQIKKKIAEQLANQIDPVVSWLLLNKLNSLSLVFIDNQTSKRMVLELKIIPEEVFNKKNKKKPPLIFIEGVEGNA